MGERLDTSDLFCEFIEVVIHNILYHRKLYPSEVFSLKKKYGCPIYVSIYPQLNQYIFNGLNGVKKLLSLELLSSVELCIYDETDKPIESYSFFSRSMKQDINRENADELLSGLAGAMRSVILRLNANSAYLHALAPGAYFKILLHSKQPLDPEVHLVDAFQQLLWIEDLPTNCKLLEPKILPVSNLRSNALDLEVLVKLSTAE